MKSPRVTNLLSKPVLRSPAARLFLMQNGRLPRYRVQIPANAKDLLVGSLVADKYFVLSVLGTGGMSVVYKAKNIPKRRVVALKTLRMQGLSDELTVKRFQREAELLSHLNHPRIVQVYDYGTTARGQPYFVMDYLQGVNLSVLIETDGPLSVPRFQNIFMQVCGAVDHAHRCGVIHRDLKPGNIMLSQQGGQRDFVKVVDFGIARFEEEAQRLTRMGEVWGSPIYMSPEQCMGAPLDARSDIYSLGIVMYEALTGQVPFLGKNYVDTMTKQINEAPRSMIEVRPDLKIPFKIDALVMKALNKEADSRYQTMSELKEELEKSSATRPPVKRAPTFDNMPATLARTDSKAIRSMSAKTLPQPSAWPRTVAGIIILSLLAVIVFLMAPVVIQTFMPESSHPPDENSTTTTDKRQPQRTGAVRSGEPPSNSSPRGALNKPRVNATKNTPSAVEQKSQFRSASPPASVHNPISAPVPAPGQLNSTSGQKTAPAKSKNSMPSFMPGISIGAPENGDGIIRPNTKH